MAYPKLALTAATLLVAPLLAFALIWTCFLAMLGLLWLADTVGFI